MRASGRSQLGQIISGLAGFVLALFAAEAMKRVFGLAVPEPVLGVMLLFLFFSIWGGVPSGMRRVSEIFLPHMALFFIPALVGLLALSDLLAQIMGPLILIIMVSTVLPLWVTASLFQKFAPVPESEEGDIHADE